MTEVLSRSPSTWNIGTTTELSQNVAAGGVQVGGAKWWKTAWRQKQQTKKKSKMEQWKQEDEGCKGAPGFHIGGADAGKPNPSQ